MKKIILCLIIVFTSITFLQSQDFKDVAKEMGINHFLFSPTFVGGGVAIFDYNNDGWMDLYMTGGIYPDKLYRNDGNGKFTNVSAEAGIKLVPRASSVQTMGVTTGDFNNDGFEDIYVTMYLNSKDFLYKNLGNGTFQEISDDAGLKFTSWSMGACFIDINLDGYLDIYTTLYSANTQSFTDEKHKIYINNKNETFTDKTEKYGLTDSAVFGLAVQATDFDNDNDVDIMVANDFGFLLLPNQLYENMYPKDTLHEISQKAGIDAAIFGMGIGSVDIDEDGDFEYYFTNIGKNKFYRNNGNKTFTNIAEETGIEHGFVGTQRSTSWSPIFIDYDNDTHMDFALTNGFVGESNTNLQDPNKLWRNKGNGKFEDVSDINGFVDPSKSRGMAMGDLNNDGKIDLVVVNLETDPQTPNNNRVYLNYNKSTNNWFNLKLEGTTANRSAIGTRAIAYAGGRLFLKEVEGGGGAHLSNNSRIQHWGMGTFKKIDSLKIIWPGGATQKFTNLPVNVQLQVKQDTKAEIVSTKNVTLCKGDIYDGKVYNESVKLENKSIAQNGMDSIAKINILVNPTYQITSNVGICLGEKFRDLTLTKDTVIIYNLKSLTGCDSICTYKLTVYQPITVNQTLSFCDFAKIDNINYTSSRTISKTVKTTVGCDSTMVTDLIINKSVATDETVSICSGDTYKGKIYTSNDNLLLSLKSNAGCDSIHTVQINVKQIVNHYSDVKINVGESFEGIKYDTAKNYYSITKVIKNGGANGCDSIFVVRLRVQDASSVESSNEFAILKVTPLGNNTYQIAYSLAKETPVRIAIINSNGSEVANYNLGNIATGEYKLDFAANNLAKGAYFVTMKLNSGVLTQKLVIIE